MIERVEIFRCKLCGQIFGREDQALAEVHKGFWHWQIKKDRKTGNFRAHALLIVKEGEGEESREVEKTTSLTGDFTSQTQVVEAIHKEMERRKIKNFIVPLP